MTECDIMTHIGRLVNDCRANLSLAPVDVNQSDVLLDGTLGIDSLDLAVLVVGLEEATGKDPFANGIVHFQTAGELASLYADEKAAC